MKHISIFDPAMCCSTGVCGPSVDPELMRVAMIVSQLQEQGAHLERFNLAQQPQAFIANPLVNAALEREGANVLPITIVDGEIVKSGSYPTNEELAAWSGVGKVLVPLSLSGNQVG